jgi:transposase
MKGTAKQSDVTIGLDLGDKRSHAVVLDADGHEIEDRGIATIPMALERAFEQYVGCVVVMEVGTHSPWVSRLLSSLGFRVIVANPRQVRLISESQHKTDHFDARMLARLGRADPELLSPVEHRGEQAQKDRALLQSRDGLVRCRVLLINQVRGMTKSLGVRVPKCSPNVFPKRVRATVDVDLFPGLSALLETIQQISTTLKGLEAEVSRLCRERYPEVVCLEQVGGVGHITSLAYVLTLEDPTRFAKSRTVGAYLGMCPRQHSSGDRQPQLRITKAGDEMLRRYLVQAAHYILGPFGPDCDLRRHGLQICERGGKNAKKRAAVAVARKLAVLLHHLWVTGEVYQPLINAERAERRAV